MNDFTPHSLLAAREAIRQGKPLKCQHFIYRMSCEDYDALMRRSHGLCEICGRVPKRPALDHDHKVGDHGVRGLVCGGCNVQLGFVDRGIRPATDAEAKYLSNPFWVARGLKLTTIYEPGHSRLTRDIKEIEAPESLWADVEVVADRRAESLSEVIRAALVAYIKKHGKEVK